MSIYLLVLSGVTTPESADTPKPKHFRCPIVLRRECGVTSVLRSKALAQGGFTSPEHVKAPLGRSAALRHGVQKETTDFFRNLSFLFV